MNDTKDLESGAFNIERIKQGTDQIRKEKELARRELSCLEFLQLAAKNEVDLMSAKGFAVSTMKMGGVEHIPEEERWRGAHKRFGLFSDTLYGIDATIEEVHDFFEAGVINPQVVGRKILFLIGPPGGGKTTLINLLSAGMERNSTLVKRYKVKGCPTHESPLHLVPRFLRKGPGFDEEKAKRIGFDKPIEDVLGIRSIEGDLCKPCRVKTLKEEFEGEWWRVPVERHVLSRQSGTGFGRFKPTKEKSTDIAALCGRENLAITTRPKNKGGGYDNPEAWDLETGEIPKSGGGLLHVIECLVKDIDTSVLRAIADLASDGYIQIEGAPFPQTWVDTVVVGDANLEGYKWFNGLKAEEALHDRIYPVFMPYTLRWGEEVRVYRKFLAEADKDFSMLREGHIAPGSLELAAKFSCLARYTPDSRMVGDNLIGKLELYNGDRYTLGTDDDYDEDEDETGEKGKPIDVDALLKEGWDKSDISEREGMFGPSPRMVLTALNQAVVRGMKESKEGNHGLHKHVQDERYTFCLTPKRVIEALKHILPHQMGLSDEVVSRFLTFLEPDEKNSVINVYKKFCVDRVKRAFVKTFGDHARSYFDKYTRHCRRWCELNSSVLPEEYRTRGRKDDVLTGDREEVDEKFLRKIESHWYPPVAESSIQTHRAQVAYASSITSGYKYGGYKPLTDACQRALLKGNEELLLTVISEEDVEHEKDEDVKKRTSQLRTLLLGEDEDVGGHCEICAQEITEDTRRILNE